MATIRFAYLDASALVAMFSPEPFSNRIAAGLTTSDAKRATMYCIVEALGVLKRKFLRKEMSRRDYLDSTYEMMAFVRGDSILVQHDRLDDLALFAQAETYVQRHNLDFIDALQLTVLLLRDAAFLRGGASESFLVTIDSDLAAAVRKEGGLAWDVSAEERPPPPGARPHFLWNTEDQG